MTIGTVSLGHEKPKFSKCSISNQNSGEGYLLLVWVFYGIIFSINTSQSDLFMTQVDYMHFLKFWVQSIQALPNSIWWLPNFGILFPTPPNMSGKHRKKLHHIINHFLSLILHLPIDSTPWFSMKNKCVKVKLCLT